MISSRRDESAIQPADYLSVTVYYKPSVVADSSNARAVDSSDGNFFPRLRNKVIDKYRSSSSLIAIKGDRVLRRGGRRLVELVD